MSGTALAAGFERHRRLAPGRSQPEILALKTHQPQQQVFRRPGNPPSLAAKARYDDAFHVLVLDELLTRDEVKTLRDAKDSEHGP